MPEKLPHLPNALIKNIADMSLRDISYVVANMLFGDDMSSTDIKKMADEAIAFDIPLRQIEPGIFALELFHGPTLTVKDISSLFMTRILRTIHADKSAPVNVMLATTGNSGSAVANSFHNINDFNVFVLYPRDVPERFLSHVGTYSNNVHTIEVSGTIDDCRRIIAKAFTDMEMRSALQLTSANSFNIGNLLPYTILYFYAYAQLLRKAKNPHDIQIAVPCGNCGNILAGYMAMQMGLPVTGLIGGCNANAGFHNMLNGIDCSDQQVIQTYAYSMDSKILRNKQRFLDLCDGDLARLRRVMTSSVATDDEIASTIIDVSERTGYVLDPHSAIAYRALKDNLAPGQTGIFMATAHPSRSSDIMSQLSNGKFELPIRNMHILKSTHRPEVSIPPTLPALKKYLKYSGYADSLEFRV